MKKLIFSILFLLLFIFCQAQLETAHWYFGENAGLDFSSGEPVADTHGALNTNEGSSSISDKQGNLLFYTDGEKVYDKTHSLMPNGTDLFGNYSSSQSGIIVPNPYNSLIYYIFTVDANDNSPEDIRGLHYSVVDMSLNSGLGDVVSLQKNIPLPLGEDQKSSEKITAVKHANKKDVWVITHFKNSFYAFLVNASGVVSVPVISTVGVNIPFKINDKYVYPNNGRGYIKASPNGKKIAIAHLSAVQEDEYDSLSEEMYDSPNCAQIYAHGGILALYDFNNATGQVSNENILKAGHNAFYGIEFSPNSKKLYAEYDSFGGEVSQCSYNFLPDDWIEGKLVQYDLNASDIPSSEFPIYTFPNSLYQFNAARGALQLALNKKIYYTNINKTALSVINNPDEEGNLVDFEYGSIPLSTVESPYGHYAQYGLPPFITSFFESVIAFNADTNVSAVCLGKSTSFSLVTDIENYTVDWNFGDGSPILTNILTPTHTYSSSGTYTVTATMHYDEDSLTITKNITIVANPELNNAHLSVCELNTDGISTFHLPDANSQLVASPSDYNIKYYLTSDDASSNDTTPLNENYQNLYNNQTIYARVTNTTGCFSIAEIELTVNNSTLENLSPLSSCGTEGSATFNLSDAKQQITTLLGNSNYNILYYPDRTNAIAGINNISDFENFTASSTTIVATVIIPGECPKYYNIPLVVTLIPILTLNDVIICKGSETVLDAGGGFASYLWNTGETTQKIIVSESGNYQVTVSNSFGCLGSADLTVSFADQPFIKEVNVTGHEAEIIAIGEQPLLYSIDLIHWQSSPIFKNIDFGVFNAYVKNKWGCISDFYPFGILNLPNIITPQGDGINDVWNIKGLEAYPGSRIRIFDRYGKLLVDKEFEENFVWDGKYLGRPVPSTAYWYIIEVTDGRKLSGWIAVRNRTEEGW